MIDYLNMVLISKYGLHTRLDLVLTMAFVDYCSARSCVFVLFFSGHSWSWSCSLNNFFPECDSMTTNHSESTRGSTRRERDDGEARVMIVIVEAKGR